MHGISLANRLFHHLWITLERQSVWEIFLQGKAPRIFTSFSSALVDIFMCYGLCRFILALCANWLFIELSSSYCLVNVIASRVWTCIVLRARPTSVENVYKPYPLHCTVRSNHAAILRHMTHYSISVAITVCIYNNDKNPRHLPHCRSYI